MKIKLLLMCLTFVSTSVFSAQTTIPKEFQGYWVKSLKNCKAETDTYVNIESKGYNAYEEGCKLIEITKLSVNTFTAKYSCEQEGNVGKILQTFSLTEDGKLLYNKLKLVRCK